MFDRVVDAVYRGRDAKELIEQTQLGLGRDIIKERFGIDTKFVDRGKKRADIWLVHAETEQLPREFLTPEQRVEMRKEVKTRLKEMRKKGKAYIISEVAR